MKQLRRWCFIRILVLASSLWAAEPNEAQDGSRPARRITGVVRDSAGAPAAGVMVSFHPGQYPGAPDYAEASTDENGRYELALSPEPTGFISWDTSIQPGNFVMARSPRRNLAAIHEFEALPKTLDLELQPGITLLGTVKDTTGKLITNATVELSILSGRSVMKLENQPTKVDAQGEFTVPALPQGRDYFAHGIATAGYGTAYGELKAVDSKTNRHVFPPFVLKRADRKLAGRVLGPDGQPLAGATLRFTGTGQQEWPGTKSDVNGNFVFDEVCEGAVQLSGSWNGPPGSGLFMTSGGGIGVKAQAGDTNIVIRLRDPRVAPAPGPQVTTTGTVFDSSGAPIPGVTFNVWRTSPPPRTATSDSTGKYTLRWQSYPGMRNDPILKTTLIARDTARNFAAAHDLDEATTNLDLHLTTGLTLSGSVQNPEGAPVVNARVALTMKISQFSAPLDQAQTDERGAFSFTALPQQGEYSLGVTADGHGSVSKVEANFAGTRSNRLELPPIRLKSANLQLAGIVVGSDDQPVAMTWVTGGGEGQPSVRSQADANGHFVFDKVAEGSIRVTATLISNRVLSATGTVQARGGDTNVILKLHSQ